MKVRLPKGMGGGPQDMNAMIRQAQKMQESMTEKQAELDALEYDFSAGGGMVSVKINGKKEILNITIKPELVDPEDVETLQDVIVAAVNEAYKSVESKNAARDGEDHRLAFPAGRYVLMPGSLTPALERLAGRFASMPGIGRKSALRLAYHVLEMDESEVREFADALLCAKESIHICPVCMNFCEGALCPVCADASRDRSVICVVEDSKAVKAIEDLNEYRGLFHILHGVISPVDGIGPEKLKIKELLARLTPEVREVILATNPSVEGEATAMYLSRLIRPLGVKVTRLAYGLPVGATLEYADGVTLLKAFEGRTEI